MPKQTPIPSIPEPLRGAESDTFAHSSVVERLPEIARRTIDENDFEPYVVAELEKLIGEIAYTAIRPLSDPLAPDADAWAAFVASHAGLNWLEVPWFFAEFYFYRRVLEATGYFRTEGQGYLADPFLHQKKQGLRASFNLISELAEEVDARLANKPSHADSIKELLVKSLWGNRADLSMWPADEDQAENPARTEKHILVNAAADVANHLSSKRSRVDIILDNAGFEFAIDLFLADYLLQSGVVRRVVLHPKTYPIFVSDVISADIKMTLEKLGDQAHPQVSQLASRLSAFLENGQLGIYEHLFWTSPLPMWEMPKLLRDELGKSDLVIFKGDANYRRLLGDRHWSFEKPFEEIMDYFPASVAALRALKSEVACGLTAEQIAELGIEDPDWMVNGSWGLIQFRG